MFPNSQICKCNQNKCIYYANFHIYTLFIMIGEEWLLFLELFLKQKRIFVCVRAIETNVLLITALLYQVTLVNF